MADEPTTPDIDRSDSVRHADEAAVESAKKKMQSAMKGETQPPTSESANSTPDILKKVRVYSPYKVYFDGPATSVSAENDTGPFDVLPGHKNFMTLIKAGEIIVRTSRGGEEHIKTNSAVMHVSANVVRVFLDV